MRMMLRQFFCCLLILVILPSWPVPRAAAQAPDFNLSESSIFISFENYDRKAGDFTLETITGQVSFVQHPGGVLTMQGNGTGTLTWDQSNTYCTDTGDLAFPAIISGSVISITTQSGTKEVELS